MLLLSSSSYHFVYIQTTLLLVIIVITSSSNLQLCIGEPIPSFGHNLLTRSLFHHDYSLSNKGLPHSVPHFIRRQLSSPELIARNYIKSKINISTSPADLKLQTSYTDQHNGLTYLFFMQLIMNTEVTNGLASIIMDQDNNIVAFHESLVNQTIISTLKPRIQVLDPKLAVKHMNQYLITQLNWNFNDINIDSLTTTTDTIDEQVIWVKGAQFSTDKIWTKPRLMITTKNNDTYMNQSLSWVIDVRAQTDQNWLNIQVSNSGEGQIIGVNDWTSAALYRVFPSVGFQSSPDEGHLVLVQDPEDIINGSPNGWSEDSRTSGNNAIVQESIHGRIRSDTVAHGIIDPQLNKLSFNYETDPLSGRPKLGLDTSLTNAFYATNLMHDILYVYGFTEKAGNFQRDNYNNGGVGKDPVIVNIQDETTRNNANFRTPPDGQSPILTSYLFDASGTLTDGALSNDILFHEYTHGMVSRLTGGQSNPNCLAGTEAAGMNEGWADMVAIMLKQRVNTNRQTNVAIAAFNTGKVSGIRRYPYSTSMTINPLTYNDIRKQTGVHEIGEIWAVILYEVYWNIVDKHGYNPEWRQAPSIIMKNKKKNNSIKISGNIMFMQLLIDGLKLQPCNPTFIQARDAILLADKINNNGDNQCELWNGFSKRGLGLLAKVGGIANDNTIPKQCK